MRYLLALLFILCCITRTIAQTDTCLQYLKDASTDYDNGFYDQSISLLTVALKNCPLPKQDQIQASKLLILCYLGIDNLEAADKTAAAIMKIDPNYTPDKFKDDPRLSSLFEKFKPEPTLAVGISGGVNSPMIDVVNTYSVVHADDKPGLDTYNSVLSYQLGAEVEKRVYKNLWAELGFQFRTSSYEHRLDSVQGSTIFYSEKINYSDFPLSVKYYFFGHSITPYLQAGADFSFLLRALSTTTREDNTDLVDRTSLRNRFMVGYFGAAGVNYTIRTLRIFGNVRFVYFPDQVNKAGTRYADDINLYKYYYVDDDFRMDNLQFNVGVSYILSYKIKKVK
jgi:hypothetical protein